jgi:hypothetical protein
MGALPCYAPSTPMHAHMALTARYQRIRLCTCQARARMHVRPISIPRSTSPHAAASAQPHSRARLRACCNRGSHGRPRLCRSGQDTFQTHVVFFIHVSALLDQVRHQLDHALLSRIKERMLGSVLAQRCLDLLLLDLIIAPFFGEVESGFAALKRAGVSAGAWRGRACMCGPSPSLALPRRTLLPRHSHTDAHDCEHAATGGRMGAPVYAEADKTRFRLTRFFSFTLAPSLIRSATSSTQPFRAA